MNDLEVPPLQSLQSLRILKLWNVNCTNLNSFASLSQLRELHFKHCRPPKQSWRFALLAYLTKLSIGVKKSTGRIIDVVGITRQLINLEELTVKNENLFS